jgi:hypothetical protein
VSESSSLYPINKGVNRPVEFYGIKAQYILYTGISLAVLLAVYAIGYMMGYNTYLLLGVTLPAGSGVVMVSSRLSKQYGEHGLAKKWASKQTPLCVRSKTWKPFFLSGK